MNTECASRRAVIFIDGQNLFRSAKEAFGHSYPNYDPLALARTICLREGWDLSQVRFYTGYPNRSSRLSLALRARQLLALLQ